MLSPLDPLAFSDMMADLLRLPDEAIAMSYVYRNRYRRFHESSAAPDTLDSYTLSLATLSLSSKATESPRRLREFILPAHRLLNPPPTARLTIPSAIYDTLRTTLVQAELILLRVLGFELRLSLPLNFVDRYLERAMTDATAVAEDYDRWGRDEREEYGVVAWMETGLERACRSKAVQACKNYQLANFFPARTVAIACLSHVLRKRGLDIEEDMARWVNDITSGKVDYRDFEEVVDLLERQDEG